MNYDKWSDIEKRSLHRISTTCSDVLNEVKNAMNDTTKTWYNPVQKVNIPTVREKPEKKEEANKNLPAGGAFLQGLGSVLACLFGAAFLAQLVLALLAPSGLKIALAVFLGLLGIGGLGLAIFGKRRKEMRKRYEAYLKLIGDQEAVSIHAISDVLGMNYRDVIKDFKEMILRGTLSPAWLDLKTYRLMLTEYTGEAPVEKKEECVSRSERILQQIRADNDLIADEEVSAKIDRIEDLTRKIFAILDKYPEKEKQLYGFLNYYLPTTLKALESYARLEAQGIETQTIRDTKQKINSMLDELCDGYERQLDKLFENDAVDITADIEVMRQMMQRDGLKANEFMKAKEVTK